MKTASMYLGLWLYNHMVHPEEEDELADYDANNPHLVLGRFPDGKIKIFRNVGALGDWLEWFGAETALNMLPKWQDGQIDGRDFAAEIAKAPVNKVVQGINPFIKGFWELATGQSTFPDFANPRTVDRTQIVSGMFGIPPDIYQATLGRMTKGGVRARDHFFWRWLIGITDPRDNARNKIHTAVDRFLAKERPENTSFKEMRRAAQRGDFEAFIEAKTEYEEAGRTFKNFRASLKFLDPLARMNAEQDEKFVNEFLSKKERDELRVARDFGQETAAVMVLWWQRSQEASGKTDPEFRKFIGRVGVAATAPPPSRLGGLSKAAIQEKRRKWRLGRAEARRQIKALGRPWLEVREAFREAWRGPSKSRPLNTDTFKARQAQLRAVVKGNG
jgi:hypothetical protein